MFGANGEPSKGLSERTGPENRHHSCRSAWYNDESTTCLLPASNSALGLRDINLARVRKTEKYQQGCEELFVVADIKRVLSNDSVKAVLDSAHASQSSKQLSVSIICTHADVSISGDLLLLWTNRMSGNQRY